MSQTCEPSYEQIKHLVEFLEHNPGIAKGVLRWKEGKMHTMRKWKLLASTINTMGGAVKNERGWAKYWAKKKCALKKRRSGLKQHTGEGIEECLNSTCELSSLDKRLVTLLEQPYFGLNLSNSVTSFTSTASTGVNKDCSTPLSSPKVVEDTTSDQEAVSSEPVHSVPPLNIALIPGQVYQFRGVRVTIATPSTTALRHSSETVKGSQDAKRTIIRNPNSYQPLYNSEAALRQQLQQKDMKNEATIKLASAITDACRSVQTATDALHKMAAAVSRLAAAVEDLAAAWSFILKEEYI